MVRLDPEPYQVQVAIKKAAVDAAETDLAAAEAQVRGQVAQTRANRYKLEHAIEDVDNQIANLSAAWRRSTAARPPCTGAGQSQTGRGMFASGAISKEDLDRASESFKVAEAAVEQALQTIYAIRVGLGLPAQPPAGQDLARSAARAGPELFRRPPGVGRTARRARPSSATFQLLDGHAESRPSRRFTSKTRREISIAFTPGSFRRRRPSSRPRPSSCRPARDLDQAELNLRYCDVLSEIDGVVTGRNVNPGNYVQVGQSLMAVRSLTEIWIDANFKETQLADLRIGQRVRCDVDMYGRRREFEGRITGFTMGTGETLALLPPQNATGNFVKIVQRLPVRIELTNYDPDNDPLFVGLSVTPYVYYKEPPTGPYAGAVLATVQPRCRSARRRQAIMRPAVRPDR